MHWTLLKAGQIIKAGDETLADSCPVQWEKIRFTRVCERREIVRRPQTTYTHEQMADLAAHACRRGIRMAVSLQLKDETHLHDSTGILSHRQLKQWFMTKNKTHLNTD